MPILRVNVIGDLDERHRAGLARRVADAAGDVLASRPGGTWVTVSFVSAEDYAENGGGSPEGALPVLVSLVMARPPEGEALEGACASLSRVVGEACGRPAERVHVLVEPPGAGRVAFGGRLVT